MYDELTQSTYNNYREEKEKIPSFHELKREEI